MAERSTLRSVRVVAPDDSLIRALAAHRPQASGWQFAPLAGAPEPDALVIVDLDDSDARRRLVGELRTAGFAGPIVILGGAGDDGSPEDEPIARPVRLGTLLARIDAYGADPQGAETYQLGPYQFIPADRVLLRPSDGTTIRLTDLERRLLACLAEAGGATVGREQLLERVWGYSAAVATHTVETHIWRLRQKTETEDPATRLLLTELGGYRLAVGEPRPASL